MGLIVLGCGGPKPPGSPPPVVAVGPLTIHRAEPESRVFEEHEDVPPATFRFDGAEGYVRATMEVESASPGGPQVNDVLFPAKGSGQLAIVIHRPTPGHLGGRVTIRCRTGEEESEAEFEPTLWFGRRTAIITFESRIGDAANPVAAGREVVLARYVARNAPTEIRLAFKAVFSRTPIEPRTKAGMKPRP